MVKNKGQGYRTDRHDKPYGLTRKVSHGRISVPLPSDNEGKTFEVITTPNSFTFILSGAHGADGENTKDDFVQVIKETINVLKAKKGRN